MKKRIGEGMFNKVWGDEVSYLRCALCNKRLKNEWEIAEDEDGRKICITHAFSRSLLLSLYESLESLDEMKFRALLKFLEHYGAMLRGYLENMLRKRVADLIILMLLIRGIIKKRDLRYIRLQTKIKEDLSNTSINRYAYLSTDDKLKIIKKLSTIDLGERTVAIIRIYNVTEHPYGYLVEFVPSDFLIRILEEIKKRNLLVDLTKIIVALLDLAILADPPQPIRNGRLSPTRRFIDFSVFLALKNNVVRNEESLIGYVCKHCNPLNPFLAESLDEIKEHIVSEHHVTTEHAIAEGKDYEKCFIIPQIHCCRRNRLKKMLDQYLVRLFSAGALIRLYKPRSEIYYCISYPFFKAILYTLRDMYRYHYRLLY